MVKGLLEFCGLGLEELARKLVNMGCNGSFVFQGHQIGVTMEFKEVVAPFMNGTHCFAHKTSLAMIILSNLPFVHQLEGVLQNLYVFFTHSLKKFLEFQKLANLINIKKQVITKCENLLDFHAFLNKMGVC
jgi:nucleoside permease NupC